MVILVLDSESVQERASPHSVSTLRHYRRFIGGVPEPSSSAFLFIPKPNATFVLSAGTGVPACDVEWEPAPSPDVILENPAFGPGEPLARVSPPPSRFGLIVTPVNCDCGAGRVMNPDSAAAFAAAMSFFFCFFSALLFANG